MSYRMHKAVRPLLLAWMLAPGLLMWLAYEKGKTLGWFDPVLLYGSKRELAGLLAGYAFTMLGFMATAVTLLFALTDKRHFRRYQERGFLGVFFAGYFICIATLMATAFLSLYGFSSANHPGKHTALLVCFASSLWQVATLTVVIGNLAKNSLAEAPQVP